MSRTLINFASFQAGWFSCVIAAANGLPWLGLLVVCLIEVGAPELVVLGAVVLVGIERRCVEPPTRSEIPPFQFLYRHVRSDSPSIAPQFVRI